MSGTILQPRTKAPENLQPESPLSPYRAFVVQFRAETKVARQHCRALSLDKVRKKRCQEPFSYGGIKPHKKVQFMSDLDEQFCAHGGCPYKREEVMSLECRRASSMRDMSTPMVR
jgi:hypothetical protein